MKNPTHTRVLNALFLALAVIVAGTVAPAYARRGPVAEIRAVDRPAGDAAGAVEELLEPVASITQQLPGNPTEALIDATATLSAEVGFPQDTRARILAADLPEEVAGRLALVVQDMLDCHRITTAHLEEIGDRMEEVAEDGDGLDPAQFTDIRTCADSLWVSTTELELALSASSPTDPTLCDALGRRSLDIWPVIRLDASCANTTYPNDYLLLVDLGGRDTYINNIGSNMIDFNFAPASSPVPGVRGFGPSRGCDRAVDGLAAGDCAPSAAVLLDMQGEDIFGVKQTPVIDAQCTSQRVIRRMVTGGVGFLGVGILRDAGDENDKYTGKTVSLGAGHIFGAGVLSDAGGNDTYESVRNSQGFALIGGAGILRDEGGNDTYFFDIPNGGVIDDENVCDLDPRFVQGAGNVLSPTVGLLIDDAGNDNYTGGFSADFDAPAPEATTGRGGSIGFGNNGAFGIFLDRAGTDTYTILGGDQGNPARRDGVVIPPNPQCRNSSCSGGVFIDQR